MSGPKVSVYTLTAEELAAIQQELLHQEQILLRRAQLLQRAQKCQQRIREQEKSLKGLENSIVTGGQWVKTDELQTKVKKLRDTFSSLQQSLNAVTDLAYNDENNNAVERRLNEVDAKLREAEREIHTGYGESADLRARLAETLDSEIFGLFETDDLLEAAKDTTVSGETDKSQKKAASRAASFCQRKCPEAS